jgi:sugar phosphate isomerase/epimerase
MNFGFSAFFYVKKSAMEAVHDILSAGIDTVEIGCEVPCMSTIDDAFVSQMAALRKQGTRFSLHAPFLEINLGSFIDEIREISKKKIKSAIDMAQRIGCNPVVVHPGYTFLAGRVRQWEEQARAAFIEDLQQLVQYAKARNISIALENIHIPFCFFYDLPQFPALHQAVPEIGMALDLGHAYVTKRAKGETDPEGAILRDIKEIGPKQITHVHLHNNGGTRDDHLFLHGSMDMGRVLDGLYSEGYGGKVIVESYDAEEYGMDAVLTKLKSLARKTGETRT